MATKRKDETQEEYNARMNAYMKVRYATVAEQLRQYKIEQGCKDCGWNEHHAGLEFDHVIERRGDESKRISALTGRGYNVVMRHIKENCEVVCSRCHSIRTWERDQARKLSNAPMV